MVTTPQAHISLGNVCVTMCAWVYVMTSGVQQPHAAQQQSAEQAQIVSAIICCSMTKEECAVTKHQHRRVKTVGLLVDSAKRALTSHTQAAQLEGIVDVCLGVRGLMLGRDQVPVACPGDLVVLQDCTPSHVVCMG